MNKWKSSWSVRRLTGNLGVIIPLLFVWIFVSCKEDPSEIVAQLTFTISPETGTKGDVVKIKGKDFGNKSSFVTVTFNDSLALIQSLNDTIIEAVVPKDAGTGLVKVTVQNTELIGPEFTYIVNVPEISSTSIDAGTFGDLMVIDGGNFGTNKEVVSVTINSKLAIIRASFATVVKVIVPDGSGTGLVRVTVDGVEVEGPSFTYGTPHPADVFTLAINIGAGARPAIAVDYDNGIVHLTYIDGSKLIYRKGDLNGNFEALEEVLTSSPGNIIWQPNLVLDEDNVPHIAYHSGKNHMWGHFIKYTNRINGSWSDVLTVFDIIGEKMNGGFNPFMVIENNTAYMTTYIIDFNEPTNAYVRIDNLDTTPIVAKKELTTNFAPAFPYLKKGSNELWVFEGRGKWPAKWVLQQLDKTTMLAIGEEVMFLSGKQGEQPRWLYDESGEIHAAGASPIWNNPHKDGWYQTLSRINAGLSPIKYKTSNLHAAGVQPVRDLVTADREYVVYWNGTYDEKKFGAEGENPYGCSIENQINFMRVENGEKVKERRRITSRSGIHGTSYRASPAVAAHPDGGMIIVFPECGEENNKKSFYTGSMQLYFTHIGKVQ